MLKDSEQNLTGEDIREGLTAIISVKIEDPQFEGQTKQKLGNSEARSAVDGIVSEQLTYFLEQNPSVAKMICEKAMEYGVPLELNLGATYTFDSKRIKELDVDYYVDYVKYTVLS